MFGSLILMVASTLGGVEVTNVEDQPEVEMLEVEAAIIAHTNEQRKRYGLEPLEVDPQLLETARKHTIWMTSTHQMVHGRYGVAENIAMGQNDSKQAVGAWMNSSGHRANILNPRHRRIGVAGFRTSNGTCYWCQQFK